MENQNNKVIYTDSYRTKDLIWDAYTGYTQFYSEYKMNEFSGNVDPVNYAGLLRYSTDFWTEILPMTEQFKVDNQKEIEAIIIKISKDGFSTNTEDYKKIREFMSKFLHISGMKQIEKDREDINKSVYNNR